MSTQLSRSTVSASEALTKGGQAELQYITAEASRISEIAKAANQEVAKVGAHAVGVMAEVTRGANDAQLRLTMQGYRSDVFDDAKDKLVQVTGQNLITMANTAQREIMKQAGSLLR